MAKSAGRRPPSSGASVKLTGTFIYTDGSQYEGEFAGDPVIVPPPGTPLTTAPSTPPSSNGFSGFGQRTRNGLGTYRCEKTGVVYEGMWSGDAMAGRGRMSYPDGSAYEGNWLNSKYNGEGTYTFLDGAKYSGEWTDGRMNGAGVFLDKMGRRWVGVSVNGVGADFAPDIV
ncbi:uncharacterized protein EV422DRAFT_511764 [Fimicolochytrium jonesii]|uniref:uncharacterized protein n=1 Tax=Fimicolochytrium jonesii TaxID=1396493 RepID=UPI0022FF459D|nr:uncharacterized protein EV422DRAFT_511764 [Fimicolochytrium jonesii]KAI8826876.1 hypothetical protein EV422DRAFT_511764 [Fimicolochytrium jonesii]